MENYQPWYTNKELFERINELSKELTETQRVVKEYNGLRQKLDEVCQEVRDNKKEQKGKRQLASKLGWAIGIIGTLIGIAGGLLALSKGG